jgi:predicted outer membrane repeat protein
MGKRSSRRIAFSLLLIGLLLVGLLPVAGIAQNDSEKEVIMSFDMPAMELIVPLGTKIEDIPLPETLGAVLESGTAADIPVSWEAGEYNPVSAGTYLFTADIGTWVYPQARPVAVVTIVSPGRNINGMLWLDKNGDGIKDMGETGIDGYPVMLYAEDNLTDAIQDTLTKTDGTYLFEGMEPGSYVVKVESEAIGETEYLLPLTISNDNKFEMDEETAASWSAPLEIAEDTVISGIDAGMRLPEGIKPRSTIWVDNFEDLQKYIWPYLSDGDVLLIGNNIVFTSSLTVKKSITIKAADGIVTLKSANQRHFVIPANVSVKLTFENIKLDGGGKVGGIDVKPGASFTMGGANIQNCMAEKGGAVYAESSRVTIEGSTISGNTATAKDYGGGGIYGKDAQITISGSTITSNRAVGTIAYGGGLYAEANSVVEIKNDSEFSGNVSNNYGGGLGVYNGSSLTVDHSDIKSNTVTSPQGSGGGIFVDKSTALIQNNSTVSGNTSAYSGSGVYVYAGMNESSSFTVEDSTISDNNGGAQGGGIMAWGSEGQTVVKVNRSTISNNEAAFNGGGLCTPGGSKITIMGGSAVSDNQAKYGGGIYVSSKSSINIIGNSKIQKNTANTSGGGIYANDSSVTLDGGTISDNLSDTAGGGAYVKSNTVFTMERGEISGNKATGGNGGGIFSDSSTVTIKAGTISGNIATDDGGGIYTKDLAKLSVFKTVTFNSNTARADAEPLPDMKEKYLNIADVESSVYDYPLNNFDINVLIVKVCYVDRSMRPIDGLGPNAYSAVLGDSFTLPDDKIPLIPGYVYVDWKEHEDGGGKGNSPVRLASVSADTDIYLVYEMRNVTVSQEVIGSYADKTRDFLFTAYFKDSEGVPLAEGTQLQYEGGTLLGSEAEAPADGMLALGENGEAVFMLKHGQKITIMAVPQGSIRVTEDSPSNYRVSFAVNSGQPIDGSNTGPVSLEEINSRFDFRNTRNEEVPTGVRAESMQGPVLLGLSMFLLMVIAGAGMIHSRRKRGL